MFARRDLSKLAVPRAQALCLLAVILFGTCAPARAAEIKVLTAGAFKAVLVALAEDFEKQSGHRVVIENDTVGALVKRIDNGAAFDLVVVTPSALDSLSKSGKVVAATTTRLAKVGVGVAVRKDAPAPDLSSVAAFQKFLLDARAVAYIDPAAGGTSGIYLSQLFEKMGIADRIKSKAVLVPGGLVAERLLDSRADVALHQISELLAVPGAQYAGPLPVDIQSYTTYVGVVGANAREPDAARQLLKSLADAKALATLRAKGMDAP